MNGNDKTDYSVCIFSRGLMFFLYQEREKKKAKCSYKEILRYSIELILKCLPTDLKEKELGRHFCLLFISSSVILERD